MAKHPVISKASIHKGLLGAWKIQFDCPECHGKLTTIPNAIGTVDDCQLCGAKFIVAESVRAQIEQIEADEENQKAEAEERRKQSELERKTAGRNAEKAKQEELAKQRRERQEREDSRGYDYPNMRTYQSYLEKIAIVGGVLGCLLATALAVWGIVQIGYGMGGTAAATFFSAMVCLLSAASWYASWMLMAEMIRLIVTVALDVRAIRDNLREAAGGSGEST